MPFQAENIMSRIRDLLIVYRIMAATHPPNPQCERISIVRISHCASRGLSAASPISVIGRSTAANWRVFHDRKRGVSYTRTESLAVQPCRVQGLNFRPEVGAMIVFSVGFEISWRSKFFVDIEGLRNTKG